MRFNREDEIRAAASDWWSLLRVPRGQKGTRTPLLCILEPINKVSIGSENILCKISDLNIDFDYVLQNGSRIMFRHEDETREYQNKLTTLHGTCELLGPTSLRTRTTKINSCLDLYFGRSLEVQDLTRKSVVRVNPRAVRVNPSIVRVNPSNSQLRSLCHGLLYYGGHAVVTWLKGAGGHCMTRQEVRKEIRSRCTSPIVRQVDEFVGDTTSCTC